MAANQGDPGSIPGGGLKKFHDSSNFVGECFSSAADTPLALDLTSHDDGDANDDEEMYIS